MAMIIMATPSKRRKRKISGQVRVALAFYTILGAAIFFFLGLLIYTFINGGLPWGKKIKEDAEEDNPDEDSEEEDSDED